MFGKEVRMEREIDKLSLKLLETRKGIKDTMQELESQLAYYRGYLASIEATLSEIETMHKERGIV